jgi:hypothetical protein
VTLTPISPSAYARNMIARSFCTNGSCSYGTGGALRVVENL